MQEQIIEQVQKVSGRMKSIANTSVQEVCAIGIIDIQNWEWAQGVGIYGLYRYYEYSRDEQELAWIRNWIDRNIKKGLPQRNINTTAPMYTVAHLAETEGKYIDLCRDWAEWVMHGLARTKYDGFQHVVTGGENRQQLWDDTLFMTVLFLAKMGVMEKNAEYLRECERQFLLHAQYLMDRSTGLWYHGWTFDGNHNFANARWARGNCWITAFIPDYLEMTGIDCGCGLYMRDVLRAQAEALVRYQNSDGSWNTLIDDPDSYAEISATAGFAYGLLKGIRLGILDESYRAPAMAAVRAVVRNIAPDGTVENVSYGTGMGMTLQDYRDIPICPMTYGQAITIMMLVEVLEHLA